MSNTNRHARPKTIVCPCPTCCGAEWPIEKIRRHPMFPPNAPPINGLTLKKIAAAIDHPLHYADKPAAGTWGASSPAPVRVDAPRAAWRWASDPEALEDERWFPVNGARIQPALDSGERRDA